MPRIDFDDPQDYLLSDDFYRYCLGLRLAFQRSRGYFDHLDLGGACGDAALMICRHLWRRGVDCSFADGDGHCWTEVPAHRGVYVVDVTATQFDPNVPPVVIRKKDELRRKNGVDWSGIYQFSKATYYGRKKAGTVYDSVVSDRSRSQILRRARRYAGENCLP